MEQTPKGELAKRLREALRGMEHTLGFKVKVVERTGRSLGSKFPLSDLWGGTKCGRTDCVTCEQVGEDLPQCTKTNMVYENICVDCNPAATSKGAVEEVRTEVPTVYIGESSRSLYERSKEHWEGARKRNPKNHMIKHQIMEHEGAMEPNFCMKVRGYYKTALARQVAEAVMIRRRGGEGAILNSRGEFNRSYIPRLQVEEQEEGASEVRIEAKEHTNRLLREQDGELERRKAEELGANAILGPKTSPKKRSKEQDQNQEDPAPTIKKRRRRLKHSLIGAGWGELQIPTLEHNPRSREPTMGDQEHQHPETRELVTPPRPRELTIDRPPREQDLRQTRLAEFLNPAPTQELPMGSPTFGNLVATNHQEPPDHHDQIGGSPRQVEEGLVQVLNTDDGTFGEKDDQDVMHLRAGIIDDQDVMGEEIRTGCDVDDKQPDKNKINIATVLPSSDVRLKQTAGRKQGGQNAVVGNTGTSKLDVGNTSMVEQNTAECVFKRGGMCTTHGCKGEKFVVTEKKWCAKGDGSYGFKSSKKTKYRCRFRGVTKSNSCNPEYGGGKKTMSSQGVENTEFSSGADPGISREGLTGLDADKSESLNGRQDERSQMRSIVPD